MTRSIWISMACWAVLMLIQSGGVLGQGLAQIQPVTGLSTASDEVVLGSDGHQVIVLSRGASSEPWSTGRTRIAPIGASPWSAGSLKDWGRIPTREPAWSELGELVHVDIDLRTDMAVISAVREGQHRVWLSGRQPDGVWSPPWPVPALQGSDLQSTFAMFDPAEERRGDLLLSVLPPSRQNVEALIGHRGNWIGGWDVVRIPRRGNYAEVWFLSSLNTTADEWALAPHPVKGGWLSTERMAGSGGVDAWWCSDLPMDDQPAKGGGELTGHTLKVSCAGHPVAGLAWRVEDLETGVVVDNVVTDLDGVARLDRLDEGARYRWTAETPNGCDGQQATATWCDSEGQVIQRFTLFPGAWVLNMLTTLDIGAWRVRALDQSRLPRPMEPTITADIARGEAAWVVFHEVGSAALRAEDALRVKAWAQSWKSAGEGMLLVRGHASVDGDPVANRRLAEERARQVAVHLEFAGIPPDRIRVEGRGSDLPLLRCPEGVSCPEGALARSRRTELFPVEGPRP